MTMADVAATDTSEMTIWVNNVRGENNRAIDEEIKKNPPKLSKDLLLRIFGYLRPYLGQMIFATVLIAIAAILDMLPSILTGRIIDEGFIGKNLDIIVKLIAVSFGVLLLSNLIGVAQSYLNAWISQGISRDMRNQLYAHLQKLSHRFYTSSRQGEIITRMTSDISGVETVLTSTVTSTISNVAILVTSVVAMYQKNWILATIGLLIVPLLVIPSKIVGKKRWSLTKGAQRENDEINQVLNETLSVSGQQLVKLFTNEEAGYAKYSAANAKMSRLKVWENMAGRWMRMAISTFTSMGPMLIYLIGGLLILRSGYANLTVGDVTVLVSLLTRMYRPVSQLMEIEVDFVRALALFGRIFDYLDIPIEIDSKPNAIKPEHVRGDISFDDVSFFYKEDNPIIEHLSFDVTAGKTVAVVGPSGAGKSTLLNLVPRLFDVCGGAVRLDGNDIRDLDLKLLRRSVGIVTQESYLFNDTIYENLRFAKPDADYEEVERACREANIHDFISGLPKGYDTEVGNRGIKLSGGEKQRISIARAILKNPAILILDEATSSLDSISESLIQEAIEPLMRQRTSIVVAHRLSTIMSADEILVMDGGKIVERGSHKELLQNNGMYRLLYETQFRQVLNDCTA